MTTDCSWSSIQKADPVLSEIRRCTLGGFSPTRKNKSLQKIFYDKTGDINLSKEMVSDFRKLYSKHRFRITKSDILESTQNSQVLFIPQSILPLVVQITHQLLGFPSLRKTFRVVKDNFIALRIDKAIDDLREDFAVGQETKEYWNKLHGHKNL